MAFLFMIRRAVIIQLIFVPFANSTVQLIILLYLQLAYDMFVASALPYRDKLGNNMEIFNEFMAFYILLFFQLLNDISNPPNVREGITDWMLVSIGFMIAVNVLTIGYFMGQAVWADNKPKFKKCYIWLKLKCAIKKT